MRANTRPKKSRTARYMVKFTDGNDGDGDGK